MKLKQWLVPAAVIVLIAGVVVSQHLLKDSQKPVQTLACSDLKTGCSTLIDNLPATVGIDGELKVLQPFTVWLNKADAEKVQASFTMEGMDMGFNLYTLRRDPDGVFRARITLPVCVSGQRDWLMTLDIDGERLAVPFVTDL
jgi:hypothetical protein